MQSAAQSPEDYMKELPEDRVAAMQQLRSTIKDNLPKGFKEGMSYGMLTYVVPFELYPPGYHCAKDQELPFISIASQKNSINIYHMGIYADENLLNWFVSEFPNHSKTKLDMGKSCIRFKKPESIPFELIADLCKKMTPEQWIALYEKNYRR
ncbi:DUF1801 domain-containing protein [Flavobacterium sp.]|uniref:DUF1801 domain-containing protein n=1 Tax=Flavobacterium sp. TaxID=239 RepID=UPI00260AF870|nr:DUF1801 domain-containing protein [Flavobacterium sp.]